uniref:Uncharacterized protein n=1 Tax=Salix viminalis TaxID=40686 RepID=A0A6N2N3U6_SALVM
MGFRDRERRETTQRDRGGDGKRRRGTTWVSGERDGSVKRNDGEEGEGKGLRESVLKGKGRESVFPNISSGKHFPQIKFIFCVDRKGGEKLRKVNSWNSLSLKQTRPKYIFYNHTSK